MSSKKRRRRPKTTAHDTAQADPTERPAHQGIASLLVITIFFSAFLLFQVQPLICKSILHWFGGTPAVWTTSMFFFQIVLLIGYVYAHLVSKHLSFRWQMLVHVGLVVAAIMLLPIRPAESWKPIGADTAPTLRLLGLLSSTVGIQFLLLSTTAPLLQVWWFRFFSDTPYKLYAVSNAGSLLALVSYPFLVEPTLGVADQIGVWSVLFFCVACSLAVCAFQASKMKVTTQPTPENQEQDESPSRKHILAWLALSTTGSVLLLAMTSHLTQNVAVVPFLWVAPLALYLLSFILSFAEPTYYRRWFYGGLMIVTQTVAAFVYDFDNIRNIVLLLLVHLAALFSGCMVCHGELAALKPRAQHLTFYFVVTSVGGALGGFLVSIVAPNVFSNYFEYPIVLIACWCLLIGIVLFENQGKLFRGKAMMVGCGVAICAFLFLSFLRDGMIRTALQSYLSTRNFYGVLSLRPHRTPEGNSQLQLVSGMIRHGSQNLEVDQEEPTSYYVRESGIGAVMKLVGEKSQQRVGMLGLGVGTMAAYSREGDYFRAYEIDQDVIDIATDPDLFTFWSLLEKRGAVGEIVMGDARISLENELRLGNQQNFDVLVVDVFSGDAIPVHLLTVEAFEVYFQHLAPHGFLAVHISNRHLALEPAVLAAAERFPVDVAILETEESEWMMLASPPAITLLCRQDPERILRIALESEMRAWTDDYSNILSVLK